MLLTLTVLPGVALVLVGEPILTPSSNPALRGVNLEVIGGTTLVAVDHNKLRTIALETVDPIDWYHPPPSWAVLGISFAHQENIQIYDTVPLSGVGCIEE